MLIQSGTWVTKRSKVLPGKETSSLREVYFPHLGRHVKLKFAWKGTVHLRTKCDFPEGAQKILLPFVTAANLLPGPWCWAGDYSRSQGGKAGGRRGTCLPTEGRRYHLWGWLQTPRRPETIFCFQLLTFWLKGLVVSAPCFCWGTCSNIAFTCACVCVCAHPMYFPGTKGPFVVANESGRAHCRAWAALGPGNCILISCQTVAHSCFCDLCCFQTRK